MSFATNRGLFRLGSAATDFINASGVKFMLLNSQLDFAKTVNFASEISANEISVSGYVGGFNGAGRLALTSRTITEDDANNRVVYDAADPTWTALGIGERIGGAAIIQEITNDAASPVLSFLDLNSGAVAITAATAANPPVLTFAAAHGLVTGDRVTIESAAGGTWASLNGRRAITVVSATTISVDGVNATGYGAYTASSGTAKRPTPTNGGNIGITLDALGVLYLQN